MNDDVRGVAQLGSVALGTAVCQLSARLPWLAQRARHLNQSAAVPPSFKACSLCADPEGAATGCTLGCGHIGCNQAMHVTW